MMSNVQWEPTSQMSTEFCIKKIYKDTESSCNDLCFFRDPLLLLYESYMR